MIAPDPASLPVSSSELVIPTIDWRRSGRTAEQRPGRSDERGRDVAAQQAGRQLDPQARLERFHVVLHDDAVQQLRGRRQALTDGFGQS